MFAIVSKLILARYSKFILEEIKSTKMNRKRKKKKEKVNRERCGRRYSRKLQRHRQKNGAQRQGDLKQWKLMEKTPKDRWVD